MTKLEKELIYTFNNISAEKMDAVVSCINPAEFALPDKAAMEIVRNRVNGYVKHESRSKYSANRKCMLSMVAAAVLVLIMTMSFSKTARAVVFEPIKKILVSVFHYVPGEGMVEEQIEEEATNEVIVVNDLDNDVFAYYVLKNEGKQATNDDISIELQRATLHEKTIEISYMVDLLKVDENEMNEVLREAIKDSEDGLITQEYLNHYVKYYRDLGYEKYFRLKPCLEPRAYTFYIKEGMAQDFEVEFKNEFEDKFILLSHEQVLDTKLFGDRDLHPKFEEYIGDYLAIAKTNSIFAYKENYVEPFKGQHGGMMDDEMMIPIIVNKKIPL